MEPLTRITIDPEVMGGKPCIRGMRVTVGTIVGFIATGKTVEDILAEYPYLEHEDVMEALSYAAWRAEEKEISLGRVGPSQRVEMVRQCRESGPKIELRTAFSASK